MAAVEASSYGQWRIFSKLGLGRNPFVDNPYACIPVLDDSGMPMPNRGKELLLSTQLAGGPRSWSEPDALLAKYTRAIVARVMDGSIE